MIIQSIVEALLFPGMVFTITVAMLFDWLERKTVARMVGRVGPAVAGPYGIFQPLADFLKLLYKEEIIPFYADKTVFRFAPGLFFLAPLVAMLFIPIMSPSAIASSPLGLLFIVFILAFATFVVAVLSYSSASSYTTIASGRLVLQYVSYEIPLVISMITPALLVRSLSVENIVSSQSTYWNILLAPVSFAVFIVALLAELEKPPFDIPSAKTEIVAGWMTEFSGRALGFLKLTKQISLVMGASLAVALFLGGPLGLIPSTIIPSSVFYTIYFLVKLFGVGLLIFVIRTALTRLRIVDAAILFWRILLPISLAQAFLVLWVRA
ncbi:MAG TPA: complex I subunit 1 family protein [Candidatus Bathyarchaeia archaeon]|nr:complex I subunit 1 family protein [Candidatus Bathyarchaeia archaeon]